MVKLFIAVLVLFVAGNALVPSFISMMKSPDNITVRSSLTNNSFDFMVYKDHDTFSDIEACVEFIHDNYRCEYDRKIGEFAEAASKNDTKKMDEIQQWINFFSLRSDNFGLLYDAVEYFKYCPLLSILYPGICNYKALFLYIKSSVTFSTDISSRGSPGIWSCFMDFMVPQYEEVNKQTLEDNLLIDDGGVITLYSGIRDSVIFNITDSYGNMNIEVSDIVTVSGYLSTTSNRTMAIEFGKGWTGATNNPVMLQIIPLKEGSKAASLDLVVINGQSEFLFPTNVKLQVTDILTTSQMDPDVKDGHFLYQVVLKEIATDKIQTVIEGADPNHDQYICKVKEENKDPSSATVNYISFVLLFVSALLLL